ncbi:MAG: hypothetical protein AAF389_01890 [Gemmatimonadota bacterium]
MMERDDQLLLAFLEGSLPEAERDALLDRLDREPELSAKLRDAARGYWAVTDEVRASSATGATKTPRVDPPRPTSLPNRWAMVAAAAVTLLISVPATAWVTLRSGTPAPAPIEASLGGMPAPDQASYVVILHGIWGDAGSITADVASGRAAQYWGWATDLADRGLLVAAGDLAWDPVRRIDATGGTAIYTEAIQDPNYVVGMFTVRAESYEEAVALARECPHLRFGGSVTVREVSMGFVTVPGMDDWSG